MAELTTRFLVTGATGYIGGSVLTEILQSPPIANASVSALVRRADQAEILHEHGVTPILFKGLDDLPALEEIARDFDIVINCALASHTESAIAMIKGQARRRERTGKEVHFIHTSGTSNLADYPISGKYIEPRIFTDRDDDIFAYLKSREEMATYAQRTTDIAVIETGLATSVRTYIIMPPTIYGIGSGLFNTVSIQIPTLMRTAIVKGRAEVVGAGDARWSHVHIADLAPLYGILLRGVLEGDQRGLAYGKRGIYFAETGEHTWLEVAEGVARAGVELGVLQEPVPVSITLQQSADQWGEGSLEYGELGWCSSSRTRAVRSRDIGWEPAKGRRDFEGSFVREFKLILDRSQKV
ncbi:hypothetical protein BJX66DRAFT_326440 [Aspergillus keveii]|uniref:NAD-dependent epimerase/dehydratase domain-containing protein n=1 Tax=Aspergillus keveii TaxID=714993 RepID=A0ABR4G1H0_9EURO